MKTRASWAVVAIISVGALTFFGVYLVSAPQDRSALLALVSPVVSAILAAFLSGRLKHSEEKTSREISEVKKLVNGNTSTLLDQNQALIEKIPPHER